MAGRWPFSHRRRASVRLRLTLTYSALFVVSGAALLGVSYLLVNHREHRTSTAIQVICAGGARSTPPFGGIAAVPLPEASGTVSTSNCKKVLITQASGTVIDGGASGGAQSAVPSPASGAPTTGPVPPAVLQQLTNEKHLVADSQAHTLDSLLIESGVALGLLTIVSLGIGWWIAGRVLRPVHHITDTARRLSEQTLHDRINLDGPRDELKDLADTFDAMLARLDRAFTSQRRFVANASHELRTPLATERVLIDEALANRGASQDDLRAILEQLRVNSEETEGLVNALLLLARSERVVQRWLPIDLAELAGGVVTRTSTEALTAGLELRTDLRPAQATGDPGLIERLTGNLVENAVRHNHAGGWVSVTTSGNDDQAVLEVINTGRVLDPDAVAGLVEPFRRDGPDRSSSDGGFGLGLSIVDAIVAAHGGQLSLAARAEGGLEVRVSLRQMEAGGSPARVAGERTRRPDSAPPRPMVGDRSGHG